ncbi:MAG TPA: potassium transporter TrkG [Bacillota bacterium]|jgi:trk system potassium uptake protein TrkH|nr:potassium transporter TrkG [Bacillota bacterium]
MKPKHTFNLRGVFRNPPVLIIAAYLAVLLLGTSLLLLPFAVQSGVAADPVTALFTATSALCVTGLTTVTTLTYWSFFGQAVILFLIQVGGLGIMTAAGGLAMVLRRRISMPNRIVLAEEKNAPRPGGMARLIHFVLVATFAIELTGTCLLSFRFIPIFGWKNGLWKAVFQAVSAYCNAGFDLIGEASLISWNKDVLVLFATALLIILGGLGFPVYRDIMRQKRWRRYRLHSKITLLLTAFLLLSGTFSFWLLEHRNAGGVLQSLSIPRQWMNAFFQSVTCRTAGFYSIPQSSLTQASCLIAIALMFVGGSPVGTAGGVKTTTLFTLLHSTRKEIGRRRNASVFDRRLPAGLMTRASAIVMIAALWCSAGALILSIAEPQTPFLDSLFEVISAFGTVGLSRDLTPSLGYLSQSVLITTMLFGKIGPLTVLYALSAKPVTTTTFEDAEESILIG